MHRIEHLDVLKLKKSKKAQKKVQNAAISFDDIDWMKHYKDSSLKSLKVSVLNKYLEAKKSQKHIHLKKKEKLLVIQHSISFAIMADALKENPQLDEEAEEAEGENDHEPQRGGDQDDGDFMEDEDDEVLDIIGMTVEHVEEEEDLDLNGQNDEDDTDDFPLPMDDSDSDDVSNIFSVTKSGRVASNWRTARYR